MRRSIIALTLSGALAAVLGCEKTETKPAEPAASSSATAAAPAAPSRRPREGRQQRAYQGRHPPFPLWNDGDQRNVTQRMSP